MKIAEIARAVELAGVSRIFGNRPALVRIDLRVERGEVLLVRGPNGAGKSTLLRMLSTALPPSEGEARVLGRDLKCERNEIRRRVEYVGHSTRLYEELTARENLRFVATLWGIEAGRIEPALDEAGLLPAADVRVATFSQGMRQRLALARIGLRAPELLLLDEPFAALDALARQALELTLAAVAARGATALLVSHDHYADSVATRTIDLTHGRIVQDASRALQETAR